ncbi:asparagine synthase (glutamine-hydrolyzing) [Chloroflexota bacterium]
MCGICGVFYTDPGRPVDRELLEGMNETLRHRGPDGAGYYLNGSVGLAMRWLAINDLETGDQPLSNEDGTVRVICDGEIYNYPILRPLLQNRGHIFRSRSDAEVIVHLYEEYGPDCVDHLRGMFAFAIWDEKQRRLLLARDRFGQKPLYYAEFDGALLFGSELKSVMQYTGLPRDLDLEAIHHYLTLQYVPDPWTPFKGIRKLPPAHRLTVRDSTSRTERYWDLRYEPKWSSPLYELKERLRETIEEAVRIRLMSDVPLGAHLSGGIDSSIVVGLMTGMMGQPVKTFSVGFEKNLIGELPHARQVAREFGTDHHEFVLKPDALDLLPRLVEHFDEPFADPAVIPTWYLAQMACEHITVVVNGDGGDEAFAGYQSYYADPVADTYSLMPVLVRRRMFDGMFQPSRIRTDRLVSLRQMSHAAGMPRSPGVVRWEGYFDESEKWCLYKDDVRRVVKDTPSTALLEEAFNRARATHRLDRSLYTDIHNHLPGALLPMVDRATMAHSLEARSPFLDHYVMELAARLPVRCKARGDRTKHVLREVFAGLLPEDVGRRSEMGSGVPLSTWFRGPLYQSARDLLVAPAARLCTYLKRQELCDLIERHREGQADNGKRIWALLNLEIWLRQHEAEHVTRV